MATMREIDIDHLTAAKR